MSKTKSKSENHTALEHYQAAKAVTAAAKTKLDAADEKKREAERKRSPGYSIDELVRVEHDEAKAEYLRALDAEELAGLAAEPIVHADELAQGDELAIAVDPKRVSADVAEALAEERQHKAEAVAARQRALQRLDGRKVALAALTERRLAAGLPPPPRGPSASSDSFGNQSLENRCAALELLAKNGPEPRSHADQIRKLEGEARSIRAAFRRAELEREERKAEQARIEREHEAERKRNADRQAKEWAESRARVAAAQAEERKLAEEHRASKRAAP
ncbi:MAG: hypothetical protein IPM35_18270 [Myxococcales bacterium]|nr:hypothetical protein [Myxococcales bacterium]